MTKQTRNVFLIVLAVLVAAFAARVILNRDTEKKAGDTEKYFVTWNGDVIFNSEGQEILQGVMLPLYEVKESETQYLSAEDLKKVNFGTELDEKKHTCTITENGADAADAQNVTVISSLNKTCSYKLYEIEMNGKRNVGYALEADGNVLIPLLFFTKSDLGNVSTNPYTVTLKGAQQPKQTKAEDVSITPPTVAPGGAAQPAATQSAQQPSGGKGVIVLDPGHGASSDSDTYDKAASGWVYNEDRGQWGEWRHWKSGTIRSNCNGSGCIGRAPAGGGCWYPIGNGDRDTEPDINLQNCLAAKRYLESMGYTVRMTRESNSENPSFSKRIEKCYPTEGAQTPDAIAYICVHSNAGGGTGSSYIQLDGTYDQAGIPDNYVSAGNALGKSINDRITSETDLGNFSGGCLEGMSDLILFCKSPVICAYMEIGFFDDGGDLAILKSQSDAIGKAIAEGISDYFGG